MDIQTLQIFITVAKLGSFTKAAEQSFISPTAVMKQINKLENELDCALLERSSTGVLLTSEGKIFIKYAEEMIELSRKAYIACQTNQKQTLTIRLGSSFLHPSQPFLAIWNRIKTQMPQYQIRMVSIPNDLDTTNREYEALGNICDILIGTYDQATTRSLVDAIPLGVYRFSISLPNEHPLSSESSLSFDDLKDATLLMVPRGISDKNDQLRTIIEKNVHSIKIIETDGRYDLDTFNLAVNKGYALINLTPWENIHPGLTSIPLNYDITVDFGILANKKTPSHVKTFLRDIQYQILTKMGESGPLKKL